MRQFEPSQTLLAFIDHIPWPLFAGLIVLSMPIIWLLAKQIARGWHRIRAWRLSQKIGPSISLSQAKAAFESYHPRYHLLEQGESVSLISWVINDLFSSSDVNKFILLGENGIGKTTFLLRLLATYQARWWKKSLRIQYISCGSGEWEEEISAIAHPERTILLLDGIDECKKAYPTYRSHLDEIFTLTASFAKLVLTCRKEYLPQDLQGDRPASKIQYVGDLCYETLLSIHIAPQKASLPFGYQEINTLIHQEIGACTQYEQETTALFDVLVQMAQMAYQNYQVSKWGSLSLLDLQGFWGEENSIDDVLKRCQLIDMVGEEYRFHHQSYMAYFLAWQAFYKELPIALTRFQDFPMAQHLYQEICWERCVMDSEAWTEDNQELKGEYYRLFGKSTKHELTTLNTHEGLQISRLYLYPDRHKDIRFLRNLDQLQSVHLLDCKPEKLPAGFVEALPNSDILLHFYPNDEAPQVLSFQEQEARLWVDEETSIPVMARSLELHEISKKADFYAHIPFPGNRRPSSEKLLSLFDTHLQEAMLRGQVNDFLIQSKDADGYELGLGLNEMDVFDRIRVIDFADQRRNVMFYNEINPTLLVHSLRQICAQLFQVLGEDDRNQEGFNGEDEAQVEDGYWMGRSWLWKNSTSYPHAVHLFMEQPGKVQLCIWGIDIESIPSEESNPGREEVQNKNSLIQETY